MKKIIFGTPVHVNFNAFLDLYKGVKLFFDDPVYLYASNENLGSAQGKLIKIEPKRNYKWRHAHNFLFDAFEYIKDMDFDYFVALDSDLLITGTGALKDFLENNNIDFTVYPQLDGSGKWYHGNIFKQNIGCYENILNCIGIRRKDNDIVGNFNPLMIFSKKACTFLNDNIRKIEASDGYKKLMGLEFSVGECLVYNILKDAGFKYDYIDKKVKEGIRYRPFWKACEFRKGVSVYHPVIRKETDLFRRLICLRYGIDRRFYYLAPVLFGVIFGKMKAALEKMSRKNKNGPDDTWFNP